MPDATPPPTAYDRYRPYRHWIEWGAWIVLILLLPVVGLIIWLVAGPKGG